MPSKNIPTTLPDPPLDEYPTKYDTVSWKVGRGVFIVRYYRRWITFPVSLYCRKQRRSHQQLPLQWQLRQQIRHQQLPLQWQQFRHQQCTIPTDSLTARTQFLLTKISSSWDLLLDFTGYLCEQRIDTYVVDESNAHLVNFIIWHNIILYFQHLYSLSLRFLKKFC